MIGIAVGVFFAGIGIGYVVLQSTITSPMMINSQQMQPEQIQLISKQIDTMDARIASIYSGDDRAGLLMIVPELV